MNTTMTTENQSGFRRYFPTFHRVFAGLFSRRRLKALGYAVLSFVALVVLFYAVENWRGTRAWTEAKAELRAAGKPLTFAELIPVLPPENENFAMSSFFKGLFDKSTDPKSGNPVWQVRQEESEVPTWPGMMKDQRERHLAQKFVFERGLFPTNRTEIDGVNLETNTMESVIQQLLESARPTMDEIQVAVRLPRSQFPVHYEDNVSALLPHLSKLKGLGQLFAIRALWHLENHNADAALKDVTATIRLAESIKDEPILISGLVSISILNLALRPVWQGLADAQWNESQLVELQSLLESFDALAIYQSNLQGERIFETDVVDLMKSDRKLALSIFGMDTRDLSPVTLFLYLAPGGWFDQNKAVMADLHRRFTVSAIDLMDRRFHSEKLSGYEAALVEEIGNKTKFFPARLLLPALSKAALKFAFAQTDVDLARTACALARYQLATGHYPESLGVLVPDYMSMLIHDVMDGKPLRYRVEGSSFVLYSIGSNHVNDGGVPDLKENSKGKEWRRDEGDWVWKYPDPGKP